MLQSRFYRFDIIATATAATNFFVVAHVDCIRFHHSLCVSSSTPVHATNATSCIPPLFLFQFMPHSLHNSLPRLHAFADVFLSDPHHAMSFSNPSEKRGVATTFSELSAVHHPKEDNVFGHEEDNSKGSTPLNYFHPKVPQPKKDLDTEIRHPIPDPLLNGQPQFR